MRFVSLLLAASALAQDTAGVGAVTGRVHDAANQPTEGARVCLVPGSRCAVSAAAGRFRITDVRPGKYQIEITPAGGAATRQGEVEVRAGLDADLDIALPSAGEVRQEVTVSAPAFVAPEEVKNSGYLVQPVEITKAAGALQDVSRYVQSLPGVVFGANDFRNDIIVRGGSPLENLFVVDNIEIPNINNFANFASAGGPVNMLDSELIQDVTFLTGGYPAPYTNRLSSVMQIQQREGDRERIRKRAMVGFSGAGGILEGPLGRGQQGSWIVSVRRSYLDAFTDDVGFGGVPINTNLNAKTLYDLDGKNRVWAVNITGWDSIRIRPDGVKDSQQSNVYNIDYNGWRAASGVNWQRLFGERGVGLLGLTHSTANVKARVGEQLFNDRLSFSDDSRENETTLKYDFTVYAPVVDKLRVGGAYKLFRNRYNPQQPLGNENPYVAAAGRVNVFAISQRISTSQSSAYVQASRDLGARVNVTYGGRVDHYALLASTRFSPRAGISVRVAPKVTLRGSAGTYYQQPFFVFVAADPVNRGLIPMRSDHIVGGLAVQASETVRFTAEVYGKRYRTYPVALEYPAFSLANTGDTFAVRNLLFPMTSAGVGRARGVEFFVEKKFTRKLFGQANLSFSRARHAALDGVLRPGSFDTPRVFNLVGGYKFNAKWELGMKYAYLSGRPYTPFDETLSRRFNRPVFDLTAINAVRAPDYHRIDFRVDRTFRTRFGPLLVFLGVQNLFDRDNFQAINWNRRTNQPKLDTQLGRFPLIGLDWRF